MDKIDQDWPEYLMLRDTKLNDDMGGLGQRIFTTAGAGYAKQKYVRADLAAPPPPAEQAGGDVTGAMVEKACRGVCAHHGWDADEPVTYASSRRKVRRPDGTTVPQWRMHEVDVRAALAAALSGQPDWQQRALDAGMQHVREPDDHYLIATVGQMQGLLRDVCGVDVREAECPADPDDVEAVHNWQEMRHD